MFNYNFYPFDNSLENLIDSDLEKLKEITEGWYIDFKEQLIDIKKIAKHISAFSNQYGGWLIIGIRENKEDIRKKEFIGVSNDLVKDIIIKIREATSAHLNPEVLYETKIVEGPIECIKLPAEKSIIIIGIPEGKNPPYVHSSGKIFKRLGDQSKEINDRHSLDTLISKSLKAKEELSSFLAYSIQSSHNNPISYIHLMTNLHFEDVHYNLQFDDFKKIMRDISYPYSIEMDNIFMATDGFIARHVFKNDPTQDLTTFRWWNNGNARITLPLNSYNEEVFYEKLNYFDETEKFLNVLKEQKYNTYEIIDFSSWLLAIASIAFKFIKILEFLEIKNQIWGKIKFEKTLKKIPFLNSISYINKIKDTGIPLIQDEIILCPHGTSFGSFFRLEPHVELNDSPLRPFSIMGGLAFTALMSAGVSMFTEDELSDLMMSANEAINQNNKKFI